MTLEHFNSKWYLFGDRCYPNGNGEFILEGAVWPECSVPIPTAGVADAGALQIGLLIYSSKEPNNILTEKRAQILSTALFPDEGVEFRVPIPNCFFPGISYEFSLSFLYENYFWFTERSVAPHQFKMYFDGAKLIFGSGDANIIYSGGADGCLDCKEPEFLHLFSSNIERLVARFGHVVAIQFAYQYVLGREPDRYGLAEKVEALLLRKNSIQEVCASMVFSDEFRMRGVEFLPHPDQVLGVWGVGKGGQ